MGTAVTVVGVLMGSVILIVAMLLRADRKDDKVQARHADVKKAKARLAIARGGLDQIEELALSLQALDSLLATGVLTILRDTRKELDKTE